jgi:gliding motility-associated-like protein
MKKLFVIILTFSCLIITNNLLGQTTNCVIQIIPNDTTLYSSSSVQIQLNTDTTASFYHWSGNNISDTTVRNPIVSALPNSSNQYILQAMFEEDSNLVINGDFEQGNTGFTSDLTYISTPNPHSNLWNAGTYAIGYTPTDYHSLMEPCTHNNGMFFMANGDSIANTIAYQTTITIQPNTYYAVSFETTNISMSTVADELPSFQFSINNNQLGNIFTIPDTQCQWNTFYQIWFSGNNTTATIKILNQNTHNGGNDFAIDNVSMKKLCVAYDTINIINDHVIYRDTIHLGACKESFPISFRDSSYNDEGTYTYTITTQDYDSIYTLIISKYPSFNDTISATICSNEVYNINGFNENTTGFYTHNLTSINGCDSIVNLSLTVNAVDSLVVFDTIYQGSVYSNYGFNVVDSGTYSHYYQLHSGCKTFVLLYLSVIERPHLDVWLPNCFTPSSNSNTTFGYYTDFENFILISFEIYNRWGEKIFYSTKKGEYWDGKYKGKDCDQSTFVWRLLYKTAFTGDCEYEKDGTVILIR